MLLTRALVKRAFQTSGSVGKGEPKGVNARARKVIIELHKENKALFGDLLETQKQRRKNAAKRITRDLRTDETVFHCNGKSDLSSELWWWNTASPNRTVRLRINRKNSALKHDKETHTLSDQAVEQNVECQKRRGTLTISSSSVENSFRCGVSEMGVNIKNDIIGANKLRDDASGELELSSDVKSLDSSMVEKSQSYVVNKTFQLPDIIVKRLHNFPLRCPKEVYVDWSAGNESLLQINSNDESCCRKENLLYPSVTKVLNATMSESSRAALDRWREKMIDQLGYEGFMSFQEGVLEQGSKFHRVLQCFLSGTAVADLSLESSILGCWKSVSAVLQNLTDVRVLESHVVHPYLKYRGIIDCVGLYCGKPVLIEWKRSDRQKPELENTFDAPVQLSAYLGAMNYDDNYKTKVQGGLVVVAYTDGSPAHAFKLNSADCNKYWGIWLTRLHQYWVQQK